MSRTTFVRMLRCPGSLTWLASAASRFSTEKVISVWGEFADDALFKGASLYLPTIDQSMAASLLYLCASTMTDTRTASLDQVQKKIKCIKDCKAKCLVLKTALTEIGATGLGAANIVNPVVGSSKPSPYECESYAKAFVASKHDITIDDVKQAIRLR